MYLGTSFFVFANGAILKYAVTTTVSGIDIQTVGVILMVAGVVGFLVSLFLLFAARDRARDVVVEERPVVRERRY
jgi:Zn-dependent membrane protease YugP